MLLPHEVNAILCDVLRLSPAVANRVRSFQDGQRALRGGGAGHEGARGRGLAERCRAMVRPS